MKKLMVLLLSFVLVFGLAACGQSQNSNDSASSEASSSENTTTASTEDTSDQTEGTGSKTLVVYYSATGNTESVANTIAEETGGDLFELEPADPYTDADLDWTDDDSRVSQEYENEDQRDVELVSATVDNWDEYDTVFIGYPIWWGIAAWPVNEFVETNDFTDKTVIPFCTSSSSGLGESGELLEEMAGTGNWQEGERFSSGVSSDDVSTWISGLNL